MLFSVFISCEKDYKEEIVKSNFDIHKDYAQLTTKITEIDTITVWMNLSQCTYQGIEKLTITREKDSLIIQPKFSESMIAPSEFIKQKIMKISVHDTIWKLNEFLKRNEKRLIKDSIKYGRLQITHNKKRIHFYTHGLGDSSKFLIDYCTTMKRLNPKSQNHIYSN